MQTRNLIQASANILKITNLVIGDCVKLVEEEYSSPQIYYGVVTDLLNSGEMHSHYQMIGMFKSMRLRASGF